MKDAVDVLNQRIAELQGQLGEMTTRRNLAENEVKQLQAENERLKGNIPAYEPPPCECCRKFTDYYAAECDCGNLGDHEAAVRWCVRMDIADSFQEVIDK